MSDDERFAHGQGEEADDDDDAGRRRGGARATRPRVQHAPTAAEARDGAWALDFSETFGARLQDGVADDFGMCELCDDDGAAAAAAAAAAATDEQVTISCVSCRLRMICLRCDRKRHARYPSLCCRWATFADGQRRNLGPEEFISRDPEAAGGRTDGDGGLVDEPLAPAAVVTRLCVARAHAQRRAERAAKPYCAAHR